MPRNHLIRSAEHYYHVMNRSNHQDWFSCGLKQTWAICIESLVFAHERHPVKIAQFVLMNNHYHMLLKTPEQNIDKFMYEFGKRFSYLIRRITKLKNRMFGGRYKWSIVFDQNYLHTVYRYIYQNPLRAGVVKCCEDYPFSTLSKTNSFPLDVDLIFDLTDEFIEWLNADVPCKEVQQIRKGLAKTRFHPISERSY